jgi:ABC-2 type transport system permease protein
MTGFALAAHQLRFDQKIFWRNPISVFFTVMFPVMFLVLVGTLVRNQTVHERGGIDATTYFVAAVITLAVVSATMVNLAMGLTILREGGILKRLRGTPLPSWVFISGRVGTAIATSLLMLMLITAIGALAFGVDVPWSRLPALLVTLAVGAASFCALGIALTAIIPSREAATPIVNAIVFPLYFLSGIFIPESEIPNGVLHVANVFPVRHLFEAFLTAFTAGGGSGFEWGDLAVVAAWGVAGVLLSVRYFRWTPSSV